MLTLDKVITFTLLADILLRFFTAVKKEDEVIPVDDFNKRVDKKKRARMSLMQLKTTPIEGLDDPKWERDISFICCKYMKNDAIADLLANIPITIYFISNGFPNADEEKISWGTHPTFFCCMLLKFLRLLHVWSVV